MVQIKIRRGLDIPVKGKPEGDVQTLTGSGEATPNLSPKQISLNLENFDLRFHLIAKQGDRVKIGDPIAEDKQSPGRIFVSPACGIITDIQRGLKRTLRNIVITLDEKEEFKSFSLLDPAKASKSELLELFKQSGIFSKIRMRPFNLLADPQKTPKAIFIKALESAPFTPPAEMQVQGYEKEFQAGLDALKKLYEVPIHLIYRSGSTFKPFLEAKNVLLHTAQGPHPIANPSLHIQTISPITSLNDIFFTLDAHDVVCIGSILLKGHIHIEKIVSIAGPGILPGKTGYFRLRDGYPISRLISGRIKKGSMRLISGDPLMGHKVTQDDFLSFSDTVFSVIPENTKRQFLHFFGLGLGKYSFSRAYLSGHLSNHSYDFTTSLHGEHRYFVDNTLYDKVQPLKISTMLLVKAILAEDFDLAETLGLLEIAPEDFALPTFVCPSKMEMVDIVKSGLTRYSHDVMV